MSIEKNIDKNVVREELNEIEFEKKWKAIKFLSSACVGAGAVRIGQIVIPKAVGVFVGETMFLGSLAIPGYFAVALGVATLLPVYSAFKKDKAEKAQRKADEIKNNECHTLED